MKTVAHSELQAVPMLPHETLSVGIDIGKQSHVAGFVSSTLLARYQRFETCPALSFENSRKGFRALGDRITGYVPLIQVDALLEVTGHDHRAWLQSLQEMDIPVDVMPVQKRQPGLLKTDKREARGLANHLDNPLEQGMQVGDPLPIVRRRAPPTPAAAQLRGMVHHHQELTMESTRRKNKLTAICDERFPTPQP
jgi:transposase